MNLDKWNDITRHKITQNEWTNALISGLSWLEENTEKLEGWAAMLESGQYRQGKEVLCQIL